MTGFNASGSDKNGVNNWNKFEKLKGQLNRFNCDLFINASMECVAYMDIDYQTGTLKLTESGFIETASLGVDLNYYMIGEFVYAMLGLIGNEDAIYHQDSVYTQSDARFVQIAVNSMMLVWTGDDGTKSDMNRTSIFYSIYKDGI